MSELIQHVLVALFVLSAMIFAIWRLSGSSNQLRWLEWLASWANPSGRVAEYLLLQIDSYKSAGCSSCGNGSAIDKQAKGLQSYVRQLKGHADERRVD
jgi:hypothetical protein